MMMVKMMQGDYDDDDDTGGDADEADWPSLLC